jgi:hypothetical protein
MKFICIYQAGNFTISRSWRGACPGGRFLSFQTLFGLGALLLRVAIARSGSLSGRLGTAAVLRRLADAAIRSFIATGGRVLCSAVLMLLNRRLSQTRDFLGRRAAFLLGHAFLLSNRNTGRSNKCDNCDRRHPRCQFRLILRKVWEIFSQ